MAASAGRNDRASARGRGQFHGGIEEEMLVSGQSEAEMVEFRGAEPTLAQMGNPFPCWGVDGAAFLRGCRCGSSMAQLLAHHGCPPRLPGSPSPIVRFYLLRFRPAPDGGPMVHSQQILGDRFLRLHVLAGGPRKPAGSTPNPKQVPVDSHGSACTRICYRYTWTCHCHCYLRCCRCCVPIRSTLRAGSACCSTLVASMARAQAPRSSF